MTITAKDIQTAPYDPAEFLSRPEAQAELLSEALQSGDPSYVAHALGVIARARGMTEVARDAGLSRETLYRSLSKNGNPELATVMTVMKVLDFSLVAQKYNTPSGPFLEDATAFIRDGKFFEVCGYAKLYFLIKKESKKFILNKFPSIVLNQYIFYQNLTNVTGFLKWEEKNSDWAERISKSIDSGNLDSVVKNIVESIRLFEKDRLKYLVKAD